MLLSYSTGWDGEQRTLLTIDSFVEASNLSEKPRRLNTNPNMSQPNDYTVGWICAIITEYIAAQVFLDKKHDRPDYISPNNNNNYTLGRIGKYNTVLAILPDGEYSISSAARVAKGILLSFPNIRIGLIVGIAGSDIIVSAPCNRKGKILQVAIEYQLEEAINSILKRNNRLFKTEITYNSAYTIAYEDNPLIKDTLVRDKLIVEKEVLYFEIEAAGLINYFSCLVIRGIYNYSDFYKNKE
ncbi:hypothetical protein EDB80DRAFT_753858 [Ilyonectria destructans]|nr:hypothetical protein EDB80DRAFT_753858 [Ilyonectria destructans]